MTEHHPMCSGPRCQCVLISRVYEHLRAQVPSLTWTCDEGVDVILASDVLALLDGAQ